ncbi:MAG TPA: endopeptidase La [Thermoanaerobaculia bacterium]|nr:endopeptidase La [Thermoanaerobaculia bacterium]
MAETFEVLPLVPLRELVVFPFQMAPFVVGRDSSIRALERALATPEKRIFLSAQKNPKIDEPQAADIHAVGVVAQVLQSQKLPNGHIKVMVEGLRRGVIRSFVSEREAYFVEVGSVPVKTAVSDDLRDYMGKVLTTFEQYARLSHHLAFDGIAATLKIDDPDRFADTLAAHLNVTTPEKQELLELAKPSERLAKLADLLEGEIEKINLERRINNKVKKQMEKAQREYYLNEKIKAIHQELGRSDDRTDENGELKKKIEDAEMPKEVAEKAMAELKRLEAMPGVSAEATVSRNYIDWLISVPWKKYAKESKDIGHAEKVLNDDHYGLEKIKERILEFLAVRQLSKKARGSIICFVGPPGVGKTSLARSIAKSMNRPFVRLSLGGVRDEAEIRGHRRTYIGAFPGQIIQMMKKAGVVNPVFLLDEVDKMSMDFRGDPSSALLEVLDPEQNHAFIDHYLDVEYDLSKVMFIATANVAHPIPAALKDRMELLTLSGYTHQEKTEIARRFLVPKQLEEHGLEPNAVVLPDETILAMISEHTREAGVRNLEREIASICRKVARKVVAGQVTPPVTVGPEDVKDYLGKPKFRSRKKGEVSEVGMATGLAWTEVGGEILTIETSLLKGKGALTLTGSLGDVMQESARAAVSYVRSRAEIYDADPDFHEKKDIHIHVPEGAIPKDGPSAGIALATSLFSAVTRLPVLKDVAMTGEITLRGKVLPVGGIKDKVLAAFRAGIRTIVLPAENEKDLEEIPKEVREAIEVHLVENMDEVIKVALDHAAAPAAKPPEVEAKLPAPPPGLTH